MSAATDVIDAEVVDDPGTDLEPVEDATATLFRTNDPVQVLAEATRTADALADVLKSRNLTTNIQGKDHVQVEGWQTLGSMLGVTPVCVWTRSLGNGWEARVEARTLDGRIVGSAEAMCTRDEKMWRNRDDYALRSMAQTRATSKALASPLRFVVTLAGYEGTPAEEMTFAERPLDMARLIEASDKAGIPQDDRQQIGEWMFNGNDAPDPERLAVAIVKIEAGDLAALAEIVGQA